MLHHLLFHNISLYSYPHYKQMITLKKWCKFREFVLKRYTRITNRWTLLLTIIDFFLKKNSNGMMNFQRQATLMNNLPLPH